MELHACTRSPDTSMHSCVSDTNQLNADDQINMWECCLTRWETACPRASGGRPHGILALQRHGSAAHANCRVAAGSTQ